jgi:hypothetical protein
MTDCQHPTLKAETITENAGRPAQKHFSFIRCTSCGNIFPTSPDPDNSLVNQLMGINSKLDQINTNIAEIKQSIDSKKK